MPDIYARNKIVRAFAVVLNLTESNASLQINPMNFTA
jgi:hypothetical protein